jgi:segregation and condensation protein B
MSDVDVIPELKQIVGALLFAAREPVNIATLRKTLRDTAKQYEGAVKDFEKATEKDIAEAIERLNADLKQARAGIHVGEVANGFRLQNDLNCGLWIRQMHDKGRANRLSKPALETLAIIAYRQPCTRQEIEAVRGVQVDAIMKNLMELQLVKAAGRSELPGKPWLFATTQKFLEYFGLKNLNDLPGTEELRRMEKAQAEAKKNEAIEAVESGDEASGEQLELSAASEEEQERADNEAAMAEELTGDEEVGEVEDVVEVVEEDIENEEEEEEEYDEEDEEDEFDDEDEDEFDDEEDEDEEDDFEEDEDDEDDDERK